MRLHCPHCDTLSRVRTSERLSRQETTLYLQCPKLQCSHTWVVLARAVRSITQSGAPHPDVDLPVVNRTPAPSTHGGNAQAGFPFVYQDNASKRNSRKRASKAVQP